MGHSGSFVPSKKKYQKYYDKIFFIFLKNLPLLVPPHLDESLARYELDDCDPFEVANESDCVQAPIKCRVIFCSVQKEKIHSQSKNIS